MVIIDLSENISKFISDHHLAPPFLSSALFGFCTEEVLPSLVVET
jgi:hypothetical protein